MVHFRFSIVTPFPGNFLLFPASSFSWNVKHVTGLHTFKKKGKKKTFTGHCVLRCKKKKPPLIIHKQRWEKKGDE